MSRSKQPLTAADMRALAKLNGWSKAELNTWRLLDECEKRGIKHVALGVEHPKVPQSVKWVFGASGSVFSRPVDGEDGWPAIWRAVEAAGLQGGAGNSYQHQVEGEAIAGYYELVDGAWQKLA